MVAEQALDLQALQAITSANTQFGAAKTNEDLTAVIAAADNAMLLADSATAPATAATAPPTRTTSVTDVVLGDTTRRVRVALEAYFRGDFDDAARGFQRLSQDLPKNGWIWAFLGASQYSQYAFEADESFRAAAIESFRKAKRLRSWKNGLPERYFSKRIRRVFDSAG